MGCAVCVADEQLSPVESRFSGSRGSRASERTRRKRLAHDRAERDRAAVCDTGQPARH
jgi:hypothetical protein